MKQTRHRNFLRWPSVARKTFDSLIGRAVYLLQYAASFFLGLIIQTGLFEKSTNSNKPVSSKTNQSNRTKWLSDTKRTDGRLGRPRDSLRRRSIRTESQYSTKCIKFLNTECARVTIRIGLFCLCSFCILLSLYRCRQFY